MPTPMQRAIDAQVELYGSTRGPFRDRKKIAEALCGVVETGRIAHGAAGIQVSHGYKSLRETNPELWTAIEEAVWKVIQAGHAPGVIWKKVASQMNKVGVKIEKLEDIMTAHAKKQSDVA